MHSVLSLASLTGTLVQPFSGTEEGESASGNAFSLIVDEAETDPKPGEVELASVLPDLASSLSVTPHWSWPVLPVLLPQGEWHQIVPVATAVPAPLVALEVTVSASPDRALGAVTNQSLPLTSDSLALPDNLSAWNDMGDPGRNVALVLPPVPDPSEAKLPRPSVPLSGLMPDSLPPKQPVMQTSFADGPRSSKELLQQLSDASATEGKGSVIGEIPTRSGISAQDTVFAASTLPAITEEGQNPLPVSDAPAPGPALLQQIVGNDPAVPVTPSMLRSAIETALRGQMASLVLPDAQTVGPDTDGLPLLALPKDLVDRLAADPARSGHALRPAGQATGTITDWISGLPIDSISHPVSAESESSAGPIRPVHSPRFGAVGPSGSVVAAVPSGLVSAPPELPVFVAVPVADDPPMSQVSDGTSLELMPAYGGKDHVAVSEVPLPKRLPAPGNEVAGSAKSSLVPLVVVPQEGAIDLPVDHAKGEEWGLPSWQPFGLTSQQVTAPQSAPAASLSHLAGRMAEALVHQPDGAIEFALAPEELGRVQFTVQTDAQNPDRVILYLSFDRPETMDLFRRHADQLADAMRSAGFSGADIGFGSSARGDDTGQSGGQGQIDNGASGRPSGSGDGPLVRDEKTRPTDRLSALGSGLDLRL